MNVNFYSSTAGLSTFLKTNETTTTYTADKAKNNVSQTIKKTPGPKGPLTKMSNAKNAKGSEGMADVHIGIKANVKTQKLYGEMLNFLIDTFA